MKKIALRLIISLSTLLIIEPNLYAGKHHNRKRVHKAQPNSEQTPTFKTTHPEQAPHDAPTSLPAPDAEEPVLVPVDTKKPQLEPGTITQELNRWYGKNRRATLEKLLTSFEPATHQFGTGESTENSALLNQAIASFINHNECKRLIDVLSLCRKKDIPLDATTRRSTRTYLNKKRTEQEERLKESLTSLDSEHNEKMTSILANIVATEQETTKERDAIANTAQQELTALRTAIATTVHVRNESGELSDDEAPDEEHYGSATNLTRHLKVEPLPEDITALAAQAQLCLEAHK